MEKIILPTKTIDAEFADISTGTGRFNALLVTDMSAFEIVRAFSNVEHIIVIPDESTGLVQRDYYGYTIFDSLITRNDGILIRLRKET